MSAAFALVLPGSINARTGGTIYDRRVVEAAREKGASVAVVELAGDFPFPSRAAMDAAADRFAEIPDGTTAVVDGLALGALPEVARLHGERLALIALVHHPLADEGSTLDEELLKSERASLGTVRGVLVTSAFTATRLRSLDLVPPELPVQVVEPGVDQAPLSSPWRPGQPVQLLSVGSLTSRKAHRVAAEALAQLDRDLRWKWTIAGRSTQEPASAASFRRTLSDLDLVESTRFLDGPSDEEVRELYRSSHVLLHPARYEGFGMVVTEALASGLPVIASNGGALPATLAGHGSRGEELAGELFPVGDADALAGCLRDLMASPTRWAEWRATAEHARRKLPGWDTSTEAFLGAIQRLARRTNPPTA